MKTIKIIFVSLVLAFGLFSCTKDFVEINTNPNVVRPEEASAKYFITGPLKNLYGPNRYPYWRAHLIHTDRYAGHVTFGFHGSWWNDGLGYTYSVSYTNASWGWLEGHLGGLDNFMMLTQTGGDFENEFMFAVAKIMKGLYYQMFTDVFGMVPYSQAADPNIQLPVFDAQKDIYKGIITDLNTAMTIIGDAPTTGDGVDDLGENDIYCGGDLQKWKAMANTLKLRIAIRAYGADGGSEDAFFGGAITDALAGPLLTENVTMKKDNEISQWNSACYGDVWYNFGLGSNWKMGMSLIKRMLETSDPRLDKYAKKITGGRFVFKRPDAANDQDGSDNFQERTTFVASAVNMQLELQGADTSATFTYTVGTDPSTDPDSVVFDIPAGFYVGQPTRCNGFVKKYLRNEFLSDPAEPIIQRKNRGAPIKEELIMSAAEAYFLQAQAALLGFGSGDSKTLYEQGVTEAMSYWKVSGGDAASWIIANSTGVPTQEDVATQRWMALLTDGFEAWSVVRKSGFPSELANGVSNLKLYELGTAELNGTYPQRLRYGTGVQSNNGANYQAAIAAQGGDHQATKLWWAK